MDTEIGEKQAPVARDEVIVFDMKQMEQREREQSQIIGREGIR